MRAATTQQYLILTPEDCVVLGPEEFGAPGLNATEVLGPYVAIQALGPLIMVHDARIEPHLGIGHHPHRYNERLFYIMSGELDHSDRLNNITGHMDAGDSGLFTEGKRGMLHSEWNHGDEETHAFILVYATEPIPDETAFGVLKDAASPRYDEGAGVRTKEIVGPRSSLRIHGDVRLFTDSALASGATLEMRLAAGEGGMVSVQEGAATIDGERIEAGHTVLSPPLDEERSLTFEAEGQARLLRVVHGVGFGLRTR